MLGDPLIDALVPPTDQNQPRIFIREATSPSLIEDAPLRREQDHARALLSLAILSRAILSRAILSRAILSRVAFRQQRLDGAKDRLRLQNHPLAAAERAVVNHVMFIECERTQIVYDDLNDPLLPRAFDNSKIERPREEFREDCQQVETHYQVSGFRFQVSGEIAVCAET
jgi:hypothetical protein